MVVENWKDIRHRHHCWIRKQRLWPIMQCGDYSANLAWTIETWGGHPDLFFFLAFWHSKFYKPSGEKSAGSNSMRWKNPELDKIIESIQKISFDDPKGIELGQQFVKLAARRDADHPTDVV